MSLRARIVALIGAVLLVSMLLGTLAAGYQVRAALAAELDAASRGAEQTVESALEDLPTSDHPSRDLRQLIATFDGNRHVLATLRDAGGAVIMRSEAPRLTRPAPHWFEALLGPTPAVRTLRVPATAAGAESIVLAPVAALDASSAWKEFVGIVGVLGGAAILGLILVFLVIGATLRPLRALVAQFGRVGAGDYTGRVREGGPSELISLQRGFNAMAGELAATTDRNRQLGDQLLTIQEEERADIARDLHDDIGPHLFAVNMDAETLIQFSAKGAHDQVVSQVRSIQGAVSHMQKQVRDLLTRLRPTAMSELGLKAAILELARFWTLRRPDIIFDVVLTVDEARLSEATKDVIYRVVQEAASNAVRHGQPRTIRIGLALERPEWLQVSVADDGAGRADGSDGAGLGLIGMRERVAGLGGTLTFGARGDGEGWMTIARLRLDAPLSDRREAAA